MKTAFITGVTGQDGAYLADFLLNQGYKVYGGFRRTSSTNLWRLEFLNLPTNGNFKLVEYNLLDLGNTIRLLGLSKPDEVYNLAAQSFVGVSFEQPVYTSMTTGIGATNLLEAIRIVDPAIKYYQASTSEMFGMVQEEKQKETTPFYPRSPYGVAKLYAHWMTINYRESYGIFGSNGILFNHESPLRGIEFVTRKITDAVSKIHLGKLDVLKLGNINASRDWGYAKDYVKGMHAMLQADIADDFVLATGVTSTIRQFVELAFEAVETKIVWEGVGINEKGRHQDSGKVLVEIDEAFFRPSEVDFLLGDFSKANKVLGWSPETDLKSLVSIMVSADLDRNAK